MDSNDNKKKQELFDKSISLYKNKDYLSAFNEFLSYYELCQNEYSKCYLFLTALNLDYEVHKDKLAFISETFKLDFNDKEDIILGMYNFILDKLRNEVYTTDTILYLQFGILAYINFDTENAIWIFNYALNKAMYVRQREDAIHNLMLCHERIEDFESAKQYAITLHKLKINEVYYITKIIVYNSKLVELKYSKMSNECFQISLENEKYFDKLKDIYEPLKNKGFNRGVILELISSLYFYLGKTLDKIYREDLEVLKNEQEYEKLGLFYAYNEFVDGRTNKSIIELKRGIDKFGENTNKQVNNSYFKDYLTNIYYLNLMVNFNEHENTKNFVDDLEDKLLNNKEKLSKHFIELLQYNICSARIKNLIKFGESSEVKGVINSIKEFYIEYEFKEHQNLLDSFLYACCVESKLDFLTISMKYIKDQKLSNYLGENIFKEIIESKRDSFERYSNIFQNCIKIKSMRSINLLKKNNEDVNELGHYTSISNIKNLVKDDTSARIRMYNASYMNDPDEGTIFLKELGIYSEDIESMDKSENPNFLFCMSKKDLLPLWVGYGNNGNGCFMQLKKETLIDKSKTDFVHINRPDKVDETLKNNSKLRGINLEEVIYNNKAKQYKADDSRAYKVIYISKHENGKIYTGSKELNELFHKLKELVEHNSEKKDNLLLKILDEIRFLFKSSTYEAEKEIRIIKKVSDKSKYKLDDRPTLAVPKLYVEIENNRGIEFEEIMIGPKVSNDDKMLLVPYFKYCDDRINVTYSSINYR